jgi:fructose-1,6-bisphosphatase/inositol monophosphatase family enzyme
MGIIYNPLLDEMYTACKGGGAYLNKRPIRVGKATVGGGVPENRFVPY